MDFETELRALADHMKSRGIDGAEQTVVLAAALAGTCRANAEAGELDAAVAEINNTIRRMAASETAGENMLQ